MAYAENPFEASQGYEPILASGTFGNTQIMGTSNLMDLYQLAYDNQKEVWAREDSAYQRMVEDMKKAGLNPWSGISSGGLSSSSQSPANSGISALFQGLTYALETTKTYDNHTNDILNFLGKLFLGLGGIATKSF